MKEFIKKHINLSQTSELKKMLRSGKLHTVCESALCPNIGECFAKKTATFLICGDICTRGCGFCGVPKGVPAALDKAEPERVSAAVKSMGLKYVVITSVTRDDLKDGGAAHFASTVGFIRGENPGVKVEVLVPDFKGMDEPAKTVFLSKPDVFSHNMETVPSLYTKARQGSNYERSLRLLEKAAKSGLVTKSGLMLGLGETIAEIVEVMNDLHNKGCSILTIGQYIAPGKRNIEAGMYYSQDEFDELKSTALAIGFKNCASSPYVRSSYMAEEMLPKTDNIN